ncbi:spore cortex biosynthesis protein YabQ [Clostridium aminobutyricum]|uniref:Spore cortex biosynthesis protein YabQ n=1 Tax=Clostridium aminobutyricum TaxID=33953 RepID=A0A939II24_CLOAM|nr:spore cortex biosynthesis protein YabQ [Clostridium aminobutyricum]MBN7774477.1 spore cortex biosynthesis protein YabQ [Clostridium aminobutyricum]
MTESAISAGFVMTDLIRSQVLESGIMLCAGMTIALLYQLFCRFKLLIITRRWMAAFFEILFWVAAGVITSEFLYYCSFGELSVHVICSFIVGVLLWTFFFCGKISKGDCKCLNKGKREEAGNSRT